MQNNYDQISLKKENYNVLTEINRQLSRFNQCVKVLKYKLCIIYQNFFSCIYKDSVENYIICDYPVQRQSIKNLFVVVDLETLISKPEIVVQDVPEIKQKLYKIIDKNQVKHAENLIRVIEDRANIDKYLSSVIEKKNKLASYMKKYHEMMDKIILKEDKILSAISDLRKKNIGSQLQEDLNKTNQMLKLDTELGKIKDVKRDIYKNIVNVQEELEHILLLSDKIFFDNNVMFDTIIKNIIELSTALE